MATDQLTEYEKFKQIFRFVGVTTLIIFVYLFCASFLPLDKENKDNIKTILIFLLGYLSANSSYLTSGNPGSKKNDIPVSGANPVVNVTNETAAENTTQG